MNPAPPAHATSPPGLAETLADMDRIKSCPRFTRPAGCGCQFGRCSLTDKPTTFDACRACLAAAEPPPL